jgi:CRISPR-associated protein Cmx8
MTTDASAPTIDLASRVHNLVAAYVQHRAEVRSRITWDSFKDRRVVDERSGRERMDVPQEYREAREKVCNDVFLAMRSRRSREEFVAYFTSTICAVPQFLPRTEFADFAAALLDKERWEDVKSLSMLALAALARV